MLTRRVSMWQARPALQRATVKRDIATGTAARLARWDQRPSRLTQSGTAGPLQGVGHTLGQYEEQHVILERIEAHQWFTAAGRGRAIADKGRGGMSGQQTGPAPSGRHGGGTSEGLAEQSISHRHLGLLGRMLTKQIIISWG